jgi:cell division control protein 45
LPPIQNSDLFFSMRIPEKLRLGDPEREHLQVLVVDSHRPHNLENVYIDRDVTDEGRDYKRARVILVDEHWMDVMSMPSMEVMVTADYDEDDEEEDEEEDDDENDELRPAEQRRKVNEDGEREEDEISKEALREKRRHKRQCKEQVAEYYKGTYRGRSAALMMFQLATQLHKDTNDMLWLAIIGLTEQYVNDLIEKSRYETEVSLNENPVL